MLPVVPYELEEIKNDLKRKAIDEFGLTDAEFEGSSVSQLINLLAYSTMTNNTNLTYGLNEMFITQASDRKNVIKHARQMGYTHKRNLSFQYKIRLRTVKEGTLTIPKYAKFSSAGNEYIYLGEDILDVYGTNIFINELWNEYNNGKFNLYNTLKKNDRIITEDGIECNVLEKYTTGASRILIESISGDLVPALSENLTQELYVVDSSDPFSEETVHRNFVKVGTVDTFLVDNAVKMFKVQVTIDPNMDFPVFTRVEYTTTVVAITSGENDGKSKLDLKTSNPIKAMEVVTLVDPDTDEEFDVQTEELEYFDSDASGYENNILFPSSTLPISEHHELTNGVNNGVKTTDDGLELPTVNSIEEFFSADIVFTDGRIQNICKEDIIVKSTADGVKIPTVETPAVYDGVDPDGEDDRETIQDGTVQIGDLIKTVQLVVAIDPANGNRYTIDIDTIVVTNDPDTLGAITILKDDAVDTAYDGYEFEVDYIRIEDLTKYEIILNYSYIKNFDNFIAKIEYVYDKNSDGYLDKRFYFSDLRGETNDNEKGYIEGSNNYGWSGFYASEYDQETSVLYFDISEVTPETDRENVLTRPLNEDRIVYHNEYVWRPSDQKDANIDGLVSPLPLSAELVTPFRKTRFSRMKQKLTEELEPLYIDGEPVYEKEENSTFCSVGTLTRKNEIEIIVKEGIMKRWNDVVPKDDPENDDSPDILLYPDLTIPINQKMAEAGHFTLHAPDIEHNGTEMFVTRIMPDGSIESDAKWNQRDYLLAEHTDVNQTAIPVRADYDNNDIGEEEFNQAIILWERHRVDETFVVLSNLEYEDYIDIYTKYAGTGTELSADFVVKVNVLSSKGAEGGTTELIAPSESLADSFEAIPYIAVSNTPHIMHAEGTATEATDSIRDNAPKFSNTANRAVTKADYKTICEAQPFISLASVWGGEEIPKELNDDGRFGEKKFGHVFFSIIPYSKPYTFTKKATKYTLDNILETALFYPSYVQITGKEAYTQVENGRKNDQNVLFSVLDNYKIITLQLNYVKAIYMDMVVDVKILKYKFGQTIIETNEQIFKAARSFIIKEVEQFDTSFFKSSLIKHIDTKLGDGYGLDVDIRFSVDLYDDYRTPENGTFTNIEMYNLVTPDDWIESPLYRGENYPGFWDMWQFEMPIAMPIEDLFEDDFISDGVIIQKGAMIPENLTSINTTSFLNAGDRLYMLTENNIVAHNRDGVREIPTSTSVRIEIAVMFERVRMTGENTSVTETFKVGTYVINRSENLIIFKLNTHGVKHIDNPLIYDETITVDGVTVPNPAYCPEVEIGVGAQVITTREVPLPREYFMNTKRTIKVTPKNSNINAIKNVYPRLKSVEFVEV